MDLSGKRFGRLTVTDTFIKVKRKPSGYRTRWLCKCDCGKELYIEQDHLTQGKTQSCGCYRREVTAKGHSTHHKADTRLYNIWLSMKGRCFRESDKAYKWYGARGISVCNEWLSYEVFYKWAMATGYDENAPRGQYTIERIDVNGNYEPNNCKWIAQKDQARNTRKTLKFIINDEEKSLREWCEIYGAPYERVIQRIKAGWNVIDALTKKKGARKYA